jgi:hypothetical protein
VKSAFECFQHAAKCEEQANQATSDIGRTMLLEIAKHWRVLGEQAKVKEANETRERLAAAPEDPTVRPQVVRPRTRRASTLRGNT